MRRVGWALADLRDRWLLALCDRWHVYREEETCLATLTVKKVTDNSLKTVWVQCELPAGHHPGKHAAARTWYYWDDDGEARIEA